jgi:para-aminobenzoate synthetase/4-amino-4-deoxychorismate lyase
VDELLDVQPHSGVWHLVSTVHGELADGVGAADLLRATFPPGSVTGAPKRAAVQAIAALEPEPRGAYTGSLGLLSPAAGADLNVVIRTFETDGDRLQLGVGGGITADSVPVREWYECLHKAAPLVTAIGGRLAVTLAEEPDPPEADLLAGGLFETVLVAYGEPVRLAGHLARLDRSVRELYGQGLPDDLPARVGAALPGAAPSPRQALRVTVRPQSDGLVVELTARRLGPRTASSMLAAAARPEHSWRHKWSDRSALERAARQTSPALPYFTAGGAVTETDRGNLFWLDPSGQWCTPPLDEQVLPGVTRREVLDLLAGDGTPVAVRRVTPAELRRAAGAFWTSSLSGAVAVTAVDGAPLPDRTAYAAALSERLGVGG